jgi:hypothetical protein
LWRDDRLDLSWRYLALVCLFFGLEFAAAGHGWMIPAVAAVTTLITGPGTGLAWALRRAKTGWRIAVGLMVFEMLVDLWLFLTHVDASDDRFASAWQMAPVWEIIWAVLFLGHQLLTCVIVISYRPSNRA